jgi:hypothetical protein
MVGIRIVNDSAEEGIVKRNGVTPRITSIPCKERQGITPPAEISPINDPISDRFKIRIIYLDYEKHSRILFTKRLQCLPG